MALLATALSADGYRKVTDIEHGDEVLTRAAGCMQFGQDRIAAA